MGTRPRACLVTLLTSYPTGLTRIWPVIAGSALLGVL